jgi:hypothetical protein
MISLEESRKEYLLCLNELTKVLNSLKKLDLIESHNNRKIGMYKFLKNFSSSFSILYEISKTNSISSLFTINRMIIDNYAIFYLLLLHSSEEEKNIRYYLFLMDGIKTRSNLVTNFLSNTQEVIKQMTENNTQLVADSDKEILMILRTFIDKNNINGIVSNEIIDQNNWKFKDPSSKKNKRENSFNWVDLYNIAKIPNHYSIAFQNYYSSYVHGLGMSILNQPKSNSELIPSLVLSVTSIIQSMLIKIISLEYNDYVKTNDMDSKFLDKMNHHWENWNKH